MKLVEKKVADGDWRSTTAISRRYSARRIQSLPIALMPAEKVTEEVFRQFCKSLKGSEVYRRDTANMVSMALRMVGKEFKVQISIPLMSKKTRVLTAEEQEALTAELMPDDRVLILMMLRMGLRRGEALGMMHEDREEDGVVVKRSVSFRQGKFIIGPPKNRSSESWVPIAEELLDEIGRGKGFIVPDPEYPNAPRKPDWLSDRVIAAAKRAGIGKVTPHDLRHTAAMNLLEAGVDIVTAAEMLRHDPVMLAKVYAKSRRDLKREAMKKLGERGSVQSLAPRPAEKNLPN